MKLQSFPLPIMVNFTILAGAYSSFIATYLFNTDTSSLTPTVPGHTSTPIQIATSGGHLYQRPSNGCIYHYVPTKYTNWHPSTTSSATATVTTLSRQATSCTSGAKTAPSSAGVASPVYSTSCPAPAK